MKKPVDEKIFLYSKIDWKQCTDSNITAYGDRPLRNVELNGLFIYLATLQGSYAKNRH